MKEIKILNTHHSGSTRRESIAVQLADAWNDSANCEGVGQRHEKVHPTEEFLFVAHMRTFLRFHLNLASTILFGFQWKDFSFSRWLVFLIFVLFCLSLSSSSSSHQRKEKKEKKEIQKPLRSKSLQIRFSSLLDPFSERTFRIHFPIAVQWSQVLQSDLPWFFSSWISKVRRQIKLLKCELLNEK